MKQQQRQRIILFLVIGWLICLLQVPSLLALEVPPLKQRVNDTAGMLSTFTKQQLEEILGRLEQTDSTQIVVLTIPSLGGEVLEEFSIKVADQWKIGKKGLDNGAILLIAKNDRKIRIEVGYGLEGSLTDLMAGRIIRNVIVPNFKAGNFDQGVIDGVQAMIGVVRGEYQAPEKAPGGGSKNKDSTPGFGGLIAFLFFISMLGRLRRPMGIAAGGILAPLAAGLFFNLSPIWILLSIPIGLLAGLILSFLGSPLAFGHGHHHRRSGGGWPGGIGGGGFSTGGFGGGGGGFGGGGASGGW